MRDIALVSFFVPLLGYALRHPWVAPLIWAWLSFMNPHRLTFGFAYSLPFAQAAAGLVFLLWLMPSNRKPYPATSTAWLLIAFYLWCCLSSLFSFNDPAPVLDAWIKVTKVQLLLFVSLMMWRGRQHINALVAVMVFSIGFFGVKGGIHTAMKGGATMVMGPPGSFIENTNDIALAMMMVIPLMYYLIQQVTHRKLVLLLWASMGLTMLAVIGTTSRGALLALLTMALLLGLKSRRQVADGDRARHWPGADVCLHAGPVGREDGHHQDPRGPLGAEPALHLADDPEHGAEPPGVRRRLQHHPERRPPGTSSRSPSGSCPTRRTASTSRRWPSMASSASASTWQSASRPGGAARRSSARPTRPSCNGRPSCAAWCRPRSPASPSAAPS